MPSRARATQVHPLCDIHADDRSANLHVGPAGCLGRPRVFPPWHYDAVGPRGDHLNPHVIVPAAKGGETSAIPLSAADGIEAAREFMALNAYGPVDTKRVNVLLRKAARQAERPAFTSYQIRHSFATALRKTGADLADIQSLYGHTNAKTTAIYAPAQLKKQQEAIERMTAASSAAGSPKTGP